MIGGNRTATMILNEHKSFLNKIRDEFSDREQSTVPTSLLSPSGKGLRMNESVNIYELRGSSSSPVQINESESDLAF